MKKAIFTLASIFLMASGLTAKPDEALTNQDVESINEAYAYCLTIKPWTIMESVQKIRCYALNIHAGYAKNDAEKIPEQCQSGKEEE